MGIKKRTAVPQFDTGKKLGLIRPPGNQTAANTSPAPSLTPKRRRTSVEMSFRSLTSAQIATMVGHMKARAEAAQKAELNKRQSSSDQKAADTHPQSPHDNATTRNSGPHQTPKRAVATSLSLTHRTSASPGGAATQTQGRRYVRKDMPKSCANSGGRRYQRPAAEKAQTVSSLLSAPGALELARAKLVAEASASNTNTRAAWAKWALICAARGGQTNVPSDDCLISFQAALRQANYSPGSIRTYVAHVKAEAARRRAETPSGPQLARALKKNAGAPKQAGAILAEDLARWWCRVRGSPTWHSGAKCPTSPRSERRWESLRMMEASFFFLLRYAEASALTTDDVEFEETAEGVATARVIIRKSKTDQQAAGCSIRMKCACEASERAFGAPLCPVHSLEDQVEEATMAGRKRLWSCTRTQYQGVLDWFAETDGKPKKPTARRTPHGARVGGTISLACANVPSDRIRRLGRWKSITMVDHYRGLAALDPPTRGLRDMLVGTPPDAGYLDDADSE